MLEIQYTMISNIKAIETATFANGCFWCTEAVFQNLDGVESVISGYSGGFVENPTYEEVCDRTTGHAECLRIEYHPSLITYEELLEVFWATHDPTTVNRQGDDVGPQYRSAIFFHTEEQKELAEMHRKKLNESGIFKSPIVTAIEPLINFFPAENYHTNYYLDNPAQLYCHYIIKPKLEKLKNIFSHKMKITV